MCECDIDNYTQAYIEVVRKARKDHSCYECGNVITKGDKYTICSGVNDHRGFSYKWCHDCATKKNLMCSIERGFCWIFGDLLTCIEECRRECVES
jgi:hypothetical protein